MPRRPRRTDARRSKASERGSMKPWRRSTRSEAGTRGCSGWVHRASSPSRRCRIHPRGALPHQTQLCPHRAPGKKPRLDWSPNPRRNPSRRHRSHPRVHLPRPSWCARARRRRRLSPRRPPRLSSPRLKREQPQPRTPRIHSRINSRDNRRTHRSFPVSPPGPRGTSGGSPRCNPALPSVHPRGPSRPCSQPPRATRRLTRSARVPGVPTDRLRRRRAR